MGGKITDAHLHSQPPSLTASGDHNDSCRFIPGHPFSFGICTSGSPRKVPNGSVIYFVIVLRLLRRFAGFDLQML